MHMPCTPDACGPHTQEVQEVAARSVEFIWRRGVFCRTEMGLMGWGQDEDQKWGTREPDHPLLVPSCLQSDRPGNLLGRAHSLDGQPQP